MKTTTNRDPDFEDLAAIGGAWSEKWLPPLVIQTDDDPVIIERVELPPLEEEEAFFAAIGYQDPDQEESEA
jgi:hypothetical protein